MDQSLFTLGCILYNIYQQSEGCEDINASSFNISGQKFEYEILNQNRCSTFDELINRMLEKEEDIDSIKIND